MAKNVRNLKPDLSMVPNDPEYRIEAAAPIAATWWRDHLVAVEPFCWLSRVNLDAVESAIRRAILIEWASRFPYHNASWPEDIPPVMLQTQPAPSFLLAEAFQGIEFPDLPVRYQHVMRVPAGLDVQHGQYSTKWEERPVTRELTEEPLKRLMTSAKIGHVTMTVSQREISVDVNGVTSKLAIERGKTNG
jgi:hypothetical protein